MTCKDCIHFDVCSGYTPTDLDSDVFNYCREGRADEIPDIEERCSTFKNKADFIEVKYGKWLPTKIPSYFGGLIWECSVCGAKDGERSSILGYYCWRCGARMDGTPKERGGER